MSLALLPACTRSNPAFGDGTGDATTDGSAQPSSSSRGDTSGKPADTGAVDPTKTSTDGTSTTGGDDDDDDDTDEPDFDLPADDTTAGDVCRFHTPAFEVAVSQDGEETPQACGEVTVFTGPVVAGGPPNTLTLRDCGSATCDCAEGPEYLLEFKVLSPSPVDAVDDAMYGCVSLSWARFSDEDGCTVAWMSMETALVQADFPRYLASNASQPAWGLVVPPAQLGERLEGCDEPHECVGAEPGHYALVLGGAQPTAVGESTPIDLDPFANGTSYSYELHPQFAQVDLECNIGLGWVAVEAG